MKSILLSFLLVSLTVRSFEQKIKPALTEADYIRKSKSQKTFAWIFLGSGVVLTGYGATVSSVTSFFNFFSPDGVRNHTGTNITIVGFSISLSSIPFFIAGHHNKLKAEFMSNKNATQ
jgi:hypothetical protein